MRRIAMIAFVFSTMSVVSAYAQQCLHGAGETPDQDARRREALAATRTINTIQANQPGAVNKVYLRHEELVNSAFAARMRESASEIAKRISLRPDEEILPGWKLTLDVTQQGYWFIIKDTTDPCGFAYVSNQTGLIFNAEPIR
jgi:hypothetical protein